jgi:two-component system, cell cycle response regulator DivK
MAQERILIVDDQPANIKLLKKILEDEDYQIQVAANATEALESVKEFSPELILMDIHLPGMGGLELTRLLRSNPESRHIKIIATSAYASSIDQDAIVAAGCDGYIPQPFRHDTFTSILRQFLDQ